MKIGVIIDSFKKDFKESVRLAKEVGADGVQIGARFLVGLTDEHAKNHSAIDIVKPREAKKILDDLGIKASAVCGDFGCDMYYTQDRKLIDTEKRLLEMAFELGTNIVTTHIGVVPENENCAQYESMHKVCYELAEYANSMGGHFAVETGPEKAIVLKSFLDSLGSHGVAVNLDPANLIMCAGDTPVNSVETLKDYIVHTHAKDGVQYKPFDTRRFYAPKYYGLEPIGDYHEYFEEVPLGKGAIDWDDYLNALRSIGYDGYLTVERECGENPVYDIQEAIKYIKSINY